MKLFRKEVELNRASLHYGNVVLARHHTTGQILGITLAFIAALILFSCFFSYSSHVRVEGILSPSAGVLQVAAPANGTIMKVAQLEGENVVRGQELFTINSGRNSLAGGVSEGKANAIKKKILALDEEIAMQGRSAELKLAQFNRRKLALSEYISKLVESRKLQQKRLDVLKVAQLRQEALLTQGFISSVQLDEKNDRLLEQMSRVKDVELAISNAETQSADVQAQIENSGSTLALSISELKRQAYSAESDSAVVDAEGTLVVKAPADGIATTTIAGNGQYVREGQTVLSIIPANSTFIATLFVPVDKIGRLQVGQRVVLRFSALDYRKYGVASGQITWVSAVALNPTDAVFNLGKTGAVDNQPVFRVSVVLDKQGKGLSQDIRLRNGMKLAAEIEVEKHKIIFWLFGPIFELSASFD